jgi:hypothetical protein
MNTTHDTQQKINTTALFHMVEVIRGRHSPSVNSGSAFMHEGGHVKALGKRFSRNADATLIRLTAICLHLHGSASLSTRTKLS